jgi:hypothetical protein
MQTELTLTCSAGLAASLSRPGTTESPLPDSASVKNVAPDSLKRNGVSRSTATSSNLKEPRCAELGYSPEDRLASQLPEPGSNLARQMTAGSGQKLFALLPRQSRLGSCMKILLASKTWGSTECWLTWKASAMKSGFSKFRLVQSMPRKREPDFGLWATPKVSTGDYCYSQGNHSKPVLNLRGQVKIAQWPAPTVSDASGACNRTDKPTQDGLRLTSACKIAQWPTPTRCSAANDCNLQKSGDGRTTPNKLGWALAIGDWNPSKNSGEIPSGLPAETENTGVPNPAFVAWLMGLPPDYWKHWETQSCGQLPLELSEQ